MEGRRPPPPASHPFPDAPAVDKFWGTPYAKGFFKFAIPFVTGWISLLCLNYYLTRNETHICGIKVSRTEEEIEQRKSLLRASSYITSLSLPLKLKVDRLVPDKDTPPGHDMAFDDGFEFAPGYNPRPYEVIDPSKNKKSS